MKIAIFTDTFTPQINGVTNTLTKLCGYLDDHKISYMLFAPDYGMHLEAESSAAVSCFAESGVIRFKGFHPFFYPECCLAFPAFSEIKSRLLAFSPDIIHVVTEFGIGYTGLKAAKELGIPLVTSYHTNLDKYLEFYRLPHLVKPLVAYMKWFHGFAGLTLCPSADTKRRLLEQGFERLDIWPRGIDTARFSPAGRSGSLRESLGGKDRLIFLYTGRISAEKGLDTLMESIRRVNVGYSKRVLFVFTGDGPYLNALQARNIPNTVFTGFLKGKELARMYASSDIFMFPSGTETFGNVVLEAMASGLPVICADEGGVTDFTFHLKNAFVFRCGDADSLAGGITRMIDDRALRTRLRSASLATARSRDWDGIFNKLIKQYESVLTGAPVNQRITYFPSSARR